MVTVAAPALKPLPEIVTAVPPAEVPAPGVTPVTCGPALGLRGEPLWWQAVTNKVVRTSVVAYAPHAAIRRNLPPTVASLCRVGLSGYLQPE
jgi:hypothetical protein